jgi:choline dehydrogenase-like flavoprotein
VIVDLEGDVEIASKFDICVIGAGAAGLMLANELIRSGKRVLLLEGGGLRRWERRSQALNKTNIIGLPYAGAHSGRFRNFGGSTTAWAGQILKLEQIDFQTRDWVPGSGWPVSRAELEPYYAQAIEMERADDLLQDDAEVWHALGADHSKVTEALSISFSRYCPERKFARLFETQMRSDANLVVALHANACELLFDEDGESVTSVRCRTITGMEKRLSAESFVLCMGGIESSRFLLNQAVAPWNRSGMVGRHFQDHIHCFAADVLDARVDEPNWPYGPWRVHGKYLPKINLMPSAQQRLKTLNVSGMIEYDTGVFQALRTAVLLLAGPLSAVEVGKLGQLIPMIPSILLEHFLTKRKPNYVLPWAKLKLSVYAEQSPLSASQISLSDRRDAIGLRQCNLDWKISTEELHTIRTYVETAKQAFEQNGIARIIPDPALYEDEIRFKCRDCFHHMGGTRMASTASDGVVDINLRLFGTRNAYVCSTSVFPSSGFASPTHTLIALAARLARHLTAQPH